MAALEASSTGYLPLIRQNRNFRFLWFGQIISLFGDWFNLIASASLVAALTQSGLAIGGLFVVRMLAPFVISPLAGVAADRYNRKHLLIWSDVIRAGTALGFLLVRNPQDVWLLYVLTAVQLALGGVFFPTRNAILPDIVDSSELGAANALGSATWSVMLAVGAALGGLVSGTWGIYPAFAIDAATFVLSAGFIALVVYEKSAGALQSETGVGAILREYVEGLRYLYAHRDILVIALLKAFMSFAISGTLQVIQVTLAERVYVIGRGGGIGLGVLYTAVGVGTGLGPILARRFTGDRNRPMRLAIALAYGIAVVGLALSASLFSFGVVLAGNLLTAIGVGINWVFATQLLLLLVPDRVRGRVFSMEFAFLTLAYAISAGTGGWLLDAGTLGISGLFWLMAGLTVVFGGVWILWTAFTRAGPPQSAPAGGAG